LGQYLQYLKLLQISLAWLSLKTILSHL